MKVLVIGCGVMGSAFAKFFVKKYPVLLNDRDLAKTQILAKEIGATFVENLSDAIREANIIILAIKPKDLATFARTTATFITEEKILMSILAGTSLKSLKKNFPKGIIVRTMPNLAFIYGQGVIGLVEQDHSEELKKRVEVFLDGIGLMLWMSEDKIEALTALSGSGIAFVLVMIEAMIDGGVHLGFTSGESRQVVLKTLEGAIALIKESGKHPADLKLQIASPAGTTIAGLKVMEEEGVRSGIGRALVACYEKAVQMTKSQEG